MGKMKSVTVLPIPPSPIIITLNEEVPMLDPQDKLLANVGTGAVSSAVFVFAASLSLALLSDAKTLGVVVGSPNENIACSFFEFVVELLSKEKLKAFDFGSLWFSSAALRERLLVAVVNAAKRY